MMNQGISFGQCLIVVGTQSRKEHKAKILKWDPTLNDQVKIKKFKNLKGNLTVRTTQSQVKSLKSKIYRKQSKTTLNFSMSMSN